MIFSLLCFDTVGWVTGRALPSPHQYEYIFDGYNSSSGHVTVDGSGRVALVSCICSSGRVIFGDCICSQIMRHLMVVFLGQIV